MLVYLNEQHTLLPSQEAALGGFTLRPVPAQGWTLDEMKYELSIVTNMTDEVCFASPIPALLGWLAAYAATNEGFSVYVLHNDRRVAKEFVQPDGSKKIIHTVAPDGWELVSIA